MVASDKLTREQSLLRIDCSSIFQGGSFASSLKGSIRRYFSIIHCENQVGLLDAKFIKVWGL
jgi:hypothetical protein